PDWVQNFPTKTQSSEGPVLVHTYHLHPTYTPTRNGGNEFIRIWLPLHHLNIFKSSFICSFIHSFIFSNHFILIRVVVAPELEHGVQGKDTP
ncbi:hypothetical protein PDJAM_G00108900, partial [Pangasius djambal]|nr:hypothetical protein [Pangasius djambal]